MAEQEMLLDSATIKAAVAGEKWATEKVIEHYAPMIDELAVDEDMKQHLIMKLLEALPNFPMEQAYRQKKQRRTQRPYSPRARRFVMVCMVFRWLHFIVHVPLLKKCLCGIINNSRKKIEKQRWAI